MTQDTGARDLPSQDNPMGDLSIWLVPAEPTAALLRQVVDELAAEHGSPAFVPHVTVLPFLPHSEEEIAAILPRLRRLLPLHADMLTVSCDDSPVWRAMYLETTPTPELQQAHDLTEELLGVPHGPYAPHLSLMYSSLPTDERRRIAASVRPPGRVVLDRLEVYRTEPGLEHVPEWRHVPLG